MDAPPLNALDFASVSPLDPDAIHPFSGKSAVHAWRGHCLATIARAEMAVTRVLLHLATEKKLGDHHLISARFDAVENLLSAKGAEAKDALHSLTGYRPWLQLRCYLAHGTCEIILQPTGWEATFQLINLNGDKPRHDRLTIAKAEAEEEGRLLLAGTDRLVRLLAPWRGEETLYDRLNMSGAIVR